MYFFLGVLVLLLTFCKYSYWITRELRLSTSKNSLYLFRVSGLSPFLGDDDNETLSYVSTAEYDFEDEAFNEISQEAKDFIEKLLIKSPRWNCTLLYSYIKHLASRLLKTNDFNRCMMYCTDTSGTHCLSTTSSTWWRQASLTVLHYVVCFLNPINNGTCDKRSS